MTSLSIPTVLEETRELYSTGKRVMAKIAYNLFQIEKEGSWKSSEKTFARFVEDEIGIGQGQTSKLLTIARFFSEKYEPEQLGTADYELLYASARLGGAPDIALSRAQTWSRDDFKADKKDECKHPNPPIPCCPDCWKKM